MLFCHNMGAHAALTPYGCAYSFIATNQCSPSIIIPIHPYTLCITITTCHQSFCRSLPSVLILYLITIPTHQHSSGMIIPIITHPVSLSLPTSTHQLSFSLPFSTHPVPVCSGLGYHYPYKQGSLCKGRKYKISGIPQTGVLCLRLAYLAFPMHGGWSSCGHTYCERIDNYRFDHSYPFCIITFIRQHSPCNIIIFILTHQLVLTLSLSQYCLHPYPSTNTLSLSQHPLYPYPPTSTHCILITLLSLSLPTNQYSLNHYHIIVFIFTHQLVLTVSLSHYCLYLYPPTSTHCIIITLLSLSLPTS